MGWRRQQMCGELAGDGLVFHAAAAELQPGSLCGLLNREPHLLQLADGCREFLIAQLYRIVGQRVRVIAKPKHVGDVTQARITHPQAQPGLQGSTSR
jgi:hypothetical protein